MRKLTAEEIECRVATVKKTGCSLLLYKNARVDQNMLDEEFGAMNWQRSHKLIDGDLYCTIEVWDSSKNMWVAKEDVGTESYTEKEKGRASDSFKRAGFNWGIGRELYTAPFIWVNSSDVKLEERSGKMTTYDHFTLKDIAYDGDKISRLEIVNDRIKQVVYTYGKLSANGKKPAASSYVPVLVPTATDQHSACTTDQIKQLEGICKENGVSATRIANTYGKNNLDELTRVQAYTIVANWDRFAKECSSLV